MVDMLGKRIMTCRGGWFAALCAVVASCAVSSKPVVDADGRITDRPVGAHLGKRHLSASGDFDNDGCRDEAFFVRTGVGRFQSRRQAIGWSKGKRPYPCRRARV